MIRSVQSSSDEQAPEHAAQPSVQAAQPAAHAAQPTALLRDFREPLVQATIITSARNSAITPKANRFIEMPSALFYFAARFPFSR